MNGDLSNLIGFLDTYSEKNNEMFKDIHSLLYFSEEKTTDNNYIHTEKVKKSLFHIKQNNIKKNKNTLPTNLPFKLYDLSASDSEYQLLSKAVFACINYTDDLEVFYDKLLKEYDTENLFKKYDFYHKIKKNQLREFILNRSDEEEYMIKLLAYYLKINIIIIKNNKVNFYCPETNFNSFRPSVILVKTENMYYYLENELSGLLTRNETLINIEKYYSSKYQFAKEEIKSVESVKSQNSGEKLSTYKKMKVGELRKCAEEFGISTTYDNNGKAKNKTKKMLLEDIEQYI
jgi:hypothetical protein